MTEFTAKSGAKVVINLAPWGDAKRLKAAILKEVATSGLKLDMEADASALVIALLSVDSSEAVDNALWPCLVRCTRDASKIVPNTFDGEDARQDYYEIVSQCVMVNLRPLVEGLLNVLPPSLLAMFQKQISPKSSPNTP